MPSDCRTFRSASAKRTTHFRIQVEYRVDGRRGIVFKLDIREDLHRFPSGLPSLRRGLINLSRTDCWRHRERWGQSVFQSISVAKAFEGRSQCLTTVPPKSELADTPRPRRFLPISIVLC